MLIIYLFLLYFNNKFIFCFTKTKNNCIVFKFVIQNVVRYIVVLFLNILFKLLQAILFKIIPYLNMLTVG